jgi:hypothetical protein
MDERVRALLGATRLRVLEDVFALIHLPVAAYPALLNQLGQIDTSGFLTLVRSAEEVTWLTTEAGWARVAHTWPSATVEAGWRLITLEQTISLDVSGYLAPLAQALAERNIPLLVVSAFSTDHLLVHGADLSAAVEALRGAIEASKT